MSRKPRRLSARFHLALTYLVIIWVTLGVLMAVLSQYLEKSAVGSRMSYLYAQAHLLSSATEARGGPFWGVSWEIGGTPARGRVLLVDSLGRVVDDSAADTQMRNKDLSGVAEIAGALSGKQMANTYYLPGNAFTAYVAVPASWEGGGAVFIAQDLSDIVAQYRDIMRAVLLGGLVASLLSLAAAWGLASVVLGPILELSATARRMASGRLDLRVTPKGPLETRDLAESFNYMASGIEKTMEAHEQFLMAAAHELRSPLAAMNATVESMEIQRPEPEELPGFFRDMKGELTRIIHTTEEILDLLRTKTQFKAEDLDGAGLVEELVETRRPLAKANSISLEFRNGSGMGKAPTILLNPVFLRLVVANLIDNALKFTGRDGAVCVQAAIRDRDFVLTVSDTGPGIPEPEIPRIFERFYRVDRARQRSTGGAGLGLSIVKEACDRSGGVVQVSSEVGRGTTFTVTWKGIANA